MAEERSLGLPPICGSVESLAEASLGSRGRRSGGLSLWESRLRGKMRGERGLGVCKTEAGRQRWRWWCSEEPQPGTASQGSGLEDRGVARKEAGAKGSEDLLGERGPQ